MTRHKWFKFDAETWLSDPKLRMVSYGAKGLWIDLICMCHISEKYGYLTLNGEKLDRIRLKSCLNQAKNWNQLFDELVENKIIRQDDNGFFYCHKLLKDKSLEEKQSEFGRLGGNPNLKGSLNPPLNPPLNPTLKPDKNKIDIREEEDKEKIYKKEIVDDKLPAQNQKTTTYKAISEDDFIKSLSEHEKEFSTPLIFEFGQYWTEKNPSGVMRFQLEKTWDTKKRLIRWKSNNFKKYDNTQVMNWYKSKQERAQEALFMARQGVAKDNGLEIFGKKPIGITTLEAGK